jgi:lipid II:glycine glycyltransferase (peptidoglycan interpeptide bridge formation enzyme)
VSQLRAIENPDSTSWDDFLTERHGHLLQSSGWGELKTRFGWTAFRLALVRDSVLVAGAQILFRRLPVGMLLAYVPRGPVIDPADSNAVPELLGALCDLAKSRGAFALKIETNWLESRSSNFQFPIPRIQLPTSNLQFRTSNSIQPRTTIHLDLTRDLDAILAQMKPKWRYNIRLAARKGITVRAGRVDDISGFYRLLQITSRRDQFAIHSEDYYRAAYELLSANEKARLFVAEYEGEPLAMIFVTAFAGEAIYLYGASSDAHRERMPNHALHWAAIQWARARGCIRYDLWGLGATTDSDATSAHGLFQFKQGFGGVVVRYEGANDVVFKRWRHEMYKCALAWRRNSLT